MPSKRFKVSISQAAMQDIREAAQYYEETQNRLGKRFKDSVKKSIQALEINPLFQIRYKNIRCLPLAKFPYMIHYSVNETTKLDIVQGIAVPFTTAPCYVL